jgi:uracil-DNA glycosylase family 4
VQIFTDFEIELDDEPGPVPFQVTADGATAAPSYMAPLARRLRGCRACTCRVEAQQVVVGVGPSDARLLFLGQNPGDDEDLNGMPFIGRAGQELDVWLRALGIVRERVAISNVVKCHTTKNRLPKPPEILTCRDLWLTAELDALPAVQMIVPLGVPATLALLGAGATKPSPKLIYWRTGVWHDRPLVIFPLPHPAYLLRVQSLRSFFLTTVLPRMAACWSKEWPEVYLHAKGAA